MDGGERTVREFSMAERTAVLTIDVAPTRLTAWRHPGGNSEIQLDLECKSVRITLDKEQTEDLHDFLWTDFFEDIDEEDCWGDDDLDDFEEGWD